MVALPALEVPTIGLPELKPPPAELVAELPVALLVSAPLKLAEPVLVAAQTLFPTTINPATRIPAAIIAILVCIAQ